MQKEKLIADVIKRCEDTKEKLNFDFVLKNQKKELINKIVDVWVEKYKYLFKINEKEINYDNYLKYINELSEYLTIHFFDKNNIESDDILWFHKLIFSIFPDDSIDKIKSWELRYEMRNVENFDENWKLIRRNMFISKNKVETYFQDELNNYNKNIESNQLEIIIHFFQWNLSKIHPFFNWNWRIFFILLDVLLLKYNFLPLFLRQDKDEYEKITQAYMISKNFKKFELDFLELIYKKYKNYHIK